MDGLIVAHWFIHSKLLCVGMIGSRTSEVLYAFPLSLHRWQNIDVTLSWRWQTKSLTTPFRWPPTTRRRICALPRSAFVCVFRKGSVLSRWSAPWPSAHVKHLRLLGSLVVVSASNACTHLLSPFVISAEWIRVKGRRMVVKVDGYFWFGCLTL